MAGPKKQSNAVPVLLCAVTLLGLVLLVAAGAKSSTAFRHQPIDFFHRVHAGDRKTNCAYCHRTAGTADFAGMPATATCMGCHRTVLTQFPEVWKLRGYWELGESIPWQRVNQLPAHVYFSHRAHVTAAKMSCVPCHGKVETMDRLSQQAPMTMGWCLACHRREHASTDCWSCHR